jgi:hypothetical protein
MATQRELKPVSHEIAQRAYSKCARGMPKVLGSIRTVQCGD